jgi:hypothetical protein
MASFQWVILCERAVIEEGAKTVSLISILENIQLPAPPPAIQKSNPPYALVPLRFFVVHQWARSNPKSGERQAGRLKFLGPHGQFAVQDFVVDLTGSQRARIIGQTIGFPLQGTGLYQVVVEAKTKSRWRRVGSTDFNVAYLPESKVAH